MTNVQTTYTTWQRRLRKLNHETPFQVIDVSLARANVMNLKAMMPRVNFYFATKSNNDRRLLEALDDAVSGFEIASLGEYMHLRSLGVASSRMLFSNPVKVPKHLSEVSRGGVRYYAFDSLGEVQKLAMYAPGAEVYARIRVDDGSSAFPLSEKFGMNPEMVVPAMRKAAMSGLLPTGLTFHVGSQSESPEVWTAAIKECGQLIEQLARDEIGITFVDIGGGLPASYTERPITLHDVASAVNTAIEQYIPPYVRILAEPGRAVAASCSVIVATVIGREKRPDGKEWLYLDMGVFQGLMEPLELPSWRYPVFTDHIDRRVSQSTFVLTGPTCDACDTIGYDYQLPANIAIGDRLYIGAAGAYTTVYGSNFNGFEPPRVHYIS